jgi:hypothetical protein
MRLLNAETAEELQAYVDGRLTAPFGFNVTDRSLNERTAALLVSNLELGRPLYKLSIWGGFTPDGRRLLQYILSAVAEHPQTLRIFCISDLGPDCGRLQGVFDRLACMNRVMWFFYIKNVSLDVCDCRALQRLLGVHPFISTLRLYCVNVVAAERGLPTILSGIERARNLHALYIDDDRVSFARLLHSLHGKSLRALVVQNVVLDDESASLLAVYLQTHASLRELRVHMCQVTPSGFAVLMRAVAGSTTLRDFVLTDGTSVDQACYVELARLLRVNDTLLYLSVSSDRRNCASDVSFDGTFSRNTTLRYFYVGLDFTDREVCCMAKELACNTALILMSFRTDFNNAESATLNFADSLASNCKLRKLYVYSPYGHGIIGSCVRTLIHANEALCGVIIPGATPPLGNGQQLDSGGDLAELPNEVLALVAARLWPARSLLELSWTCQLLRDNAITNYVAHLRYGTRADWRLNLREAYIEARQQ